MACHLSGSGQFTERMVHSPYGGVSLLIFGLALSSPLVLAVFTQRGRRLLNAIARFAARMPRITGAVLVLLGVWSIGLAL